MAVSVPFKLRLTGDTAERHEFQAYDGYMALAGVARTLSLVAHYAETGKIRQRGEFEGRNAVRGSAIRNGSILVDLAVLLEQMPAEVFGVVGIAGVAGGKFLYALVDRVLARNLGEEPSEDLILGPLLERRSGDLEALVAVSEPAIRQAHSVIGNGASMMQIIGGANILNTFNEDTKQYVQGTVVDDTVRTSNFTVSAFNANSGYGSVFDSTIGRTVPFKMKRAVLDSVRTVFSWGIDQYTNRTGFGITATYTRELALDGRPKRYLMIGATKNLQSSSDFNESTKRP